MLEKSDYIRYLQAADLSDARRYFELARLTTRQHDKAELMAGALVGIIVALIVSGGTWPFTLLAGLGAFGATLLVIFLIHWIRSPSAFYRAAVAEIGNKDKELEEIKNKNREIRRSFVIEQLKDLISEYREIDVYPDLSQPVEKHVHDLSKIIDHSLRLQKLVERYIAPEHLAVYPGTDHLWHQQHIRQVMDDLLLRLVDGEIDIKA